MHTRALLIALSLVTCASPAAAQVSEPIGRYVADVRGVWARLKQDATIATVLAVEPDDVPARGFGFVLGAHWYPLRYHQITFGLGGELLAGRGNRTRPAQSEGQPDGPAVETRVTSISPQISFNFGKRDGWSYISGGIGFADFTAERVDVPFGAPAGRTRSINYGGGARWFTGAHLAVSIDLRFYTIDAQLPSAGRPPFPRQRFMVISAGVGAR